MTKKGTPDFKRYTREIKVVPASQIIDHANRFVYGWLMPFRDTIHGIELTFLMINTALIATGNQQKLESILSRASEDLTASFDRLSTLVEYAPVPLPDKMRADMANMGALILKVRHGLKRCIYGKDGGAALRELAINEADSDPLKALMRDMQKHLESLGRAVDPVGDYINERLHPMIAEGRKFDAARYEIRRQLEDKYHRQGGLDFPEDEALSDLRAISSKTLRKRYERWKGRQERAIVTHENATE